MRKTDQRGLVLLQTLVFIVLMALIGTTLLQCVFARSIVVHRANDSEAKRQLALGAQSRLLSCLRDTPFGANQAACDLAPYESCVPREIAGRPVTVEAAWSAPDCRLSISVAD